MTNVIKSGWRLRGIGWVMLLVGILLTPFPSWPASGQGQDFTGHGPMLEESFAVSNIWSGPWMVYVQGSDPVGDMTYLWFEVTQLGGRNSTELIYLKGENRRHFSGYVAIYLPGRRVGWETVRAEIRIKDAAGNYSGKSTHEVRVGAPTTEAIPAKWRMASQNRLGNIFFSFDSEASDMWRR